MTFKELVNQYNNVDFGELGNNKLTVLKNCLKSVTDKDITSSKDGKAYIDLLSKFRKAVFENDKLHGENYISTLNSILSVGEDGLYSNNLRFIFELIQNVDDCDFSSANDCKLEIHFDFNFNKIVLTYNEKGFTPFNVFAITGIAEAAKNIFSSKTEIGEKGLGFKSVFGVAKKVLIQSGWFSFELFKENFTIPVSNYQSFDYCPGTRMTLYVDQAEKIYREIKSQYCSKEALFSRNPLLFLNKLTYLKIYFDAWRSMEFKVSRSEPSSKNTIDVERNVELSVKLHDYENGKEINIKEKISCSRYSYPVVISKEACQSRYGNNTQIGNPNGKKMTLLAILPNPEHLSDVGMGALYSFLPTQLRMTIPLACHVPFKLDASREFVDPQGKNLWFKEASVYLSELIDYVFMDWRSVVKEDIVKFIPGVKDNIFAANNGKELCLRRQESFSGAHYLDLPLFITTDGTYHKASEIFCFRKEEKITEPEKVFSMMGYKGYLFIPSPSAPIKNFEFKTAYKIKDELFKRAFTEPTITSEALQYLDSTDYVYDKKNVLDQDNLSLTPEQVETMFEHSKLAELLQSIGCNEVKKIRRLKISVTKASSHPIKDILCDDFNLSQAPLEVQKYMQFCNEQYICLDIGEDNYFPCYNAIILSKRNPLASFAAFCNAIKKDDIFAILIKLHEEREKLKQYIDKDIGSAADYLRYLQGYCSLTKSSLGKSGYENYIDLILKSGTNNGRFIQELLQNADDCDYLPGVVPTFSLMQNGKSVLVEYNEVGFTRANIYSIAAIGESTKKRLSNGQLNAIGEKGVGFKTIFADASEVRIYSGEYSFSLSKHEPTIPKLLIVSNQAPTAGTRMEVILNDNSHFPTYNENTILKLCLCLRKLRSIKIGSHSVYIEDADDRRTITIDNRQYVFKRFTHTFTIKNENALRERSGEIRAISPEQSIICFVPDKSNLTEEFALYNGLPTKHKIKIPMAIDAPFSLITSREEIETDSSVWNSIIRKEFYAAIMSVINSLKATERAKIFRFTKFVHRMHGNSNVYVNDISDCEYLKSFDFLSILKSSEIIPTLDRNTFQTPQSKEAYRFSKAATILFGKVSPSEYAGIQPSSIIDVEGTDYDSTLKALECATASFNQEYLIIKEHAERFIKQDDFRANLYELLQDAPSEFKEKMRSIAIIPVYGQISGSVEYICWKNDSIFVKRGASSSPAEYYVLNEKLMSKIVCEKIFESNINEMNAEWERNRYNHRLKQIIRGKNIEEIYQYLIAEFKSGAFERNNSFDVLNADLERIPLKNEMGEIVDTHLFLCNKDFGYFQVEMIQRLIVHKECERFAEFMHCSDLENIHYDDIDYYEKLTADDIETLLDNYFKNSEEILRGFYKDGRLSYELLSEYGLEYLSFNRTNDYEESYQFPSDPAGDKNLIKKHVQERWRDPISVVSVQEVRTVQKWKDHSGYIFDLSSEDYRDGALHIYTADIAKKLCFCQMCHKVKHYKMIEVNNIEVKPKYFFPKLRIALCLECSKHFESLRSNDTIRTNFINEIKSTSIENQDTVNIHIGYNETITFTAKHLAEIQEIFNQMPKQ